MRYRGPDAELDSASLLQADLDDGVLNIVLNCPQQSQGQAAQTASALARLLTAASEDAAVRVLLLRGNDLDFGAAPEAGDAAGHATSVAQALRRLPQTVVAMVRGPCRGAALALIETCDIVIAADDACLGSDDLATLSVPASELEAWTHQLARELAAKDALALRFTKDTLRRVPDVGWDEVLNFTSARQAELKALQAGRPSARAQAVESFLAGKTKPGAGG